MRKLPGIVSVLFAAVLALTLASPLAAAGPDLTARAFDVRYAGGAVEVNFALALSEVSSYPVTITAIAGPTEEVLYEGSLGAGVYRFSAPLTKISGSGNLKIVLRTRVTNRSEKGSETFAVYQTWQGSM